MCAFYCFACPAQMFNQPHDHEPVMRLSMMMRGADEEASSQSRALITNTLKHHQETVDSQRQRQAAHDELRIQRQIDLAEAAEKEDARRREAEEQAEAENQRRLMRLYRYRPPSAACKAPSPPRRDSSPFSDSIEAPKTHSSKRGVTFVEEPSSGSPRVEFDSPPVSPTAVPRRRSTAVSISSSVAYAGSSPFANGGDSTSLDSKRRSSEFESRMDSAIGADNDRRRKSMFSFLPSSIAAPPSTSSHQTRRRASHNTSSIPISLISIQETIALRTLYERCTEEGIGYAASVSAAGDGLSVGALASTMPATPTTSKAPTGVTMGSATSVFRPLTFDTFHVSTLLHTANLCTVPPAPEISRIIAKVRLCHLGTGEATSYQGPAVSTNVIGGKGPVVEDHDDAIHLHHTSSAVFPTAVLSSNPTLSFQMLLEVVQLAKEWNKKVTAAIDACSDSYINITTNRAAIEGGKAFTVAGPDAEEDDDSIESNGEDLPQENDPEREKREADDMRRKEQNKKLIRVKDIEKVLRKVGVEYDFDTLFHGVDPHYDGKHITPKLFRWLAGSEDPAIVKSFVALGGEETLSGTIPVDVVISKCAAMNMTPQFIANFVAVADANDDGVVDFNEFLAMVIRNRIETKGTDSATTRTWSVANLAKEAKPSGTSSLLRRVGSGFKDTDETWTDEERAAVENNLLDFFNLTGATISADATVKAPELTVDEIERQDAPHITVSASFGSPSPDRAEDSNRAASTLRERRGSDQSATGSDVPFPRRARFSIQPDGVADLPRPQSPGLGSRTIQPLPETGDIFESDVFVDPEQAYAAATSAANVLATIQETYFDDEDVESEGASSDHGSSDGFGARPRSPYSDGLLHKGDARSSGSTSARLLKMEALRVRSDEDTGSTSAMLHDVNIAAAAVFGNDPASPTSGTHLRESMSSSRIAGGKIGAQAAKMVERTTELIAQQRARCGVVMGRLTKHRPAPIVATSEGPFKVRDTCTAARERSRMKLEHKPKKHLPATCPRLFALNMHTIEDLELAVRNEQTQLAALQPSLKSPTTSVQLEKKNPKQPRPSTAPFRRPLTASCARGVLRPTEEPSVEPASLLVRDKRHHLSAAPPPALVPNPPPPRRPKPEPKEDDTALVDSDLEEAHAVHVERNAPRRPAAAPFPHRPPSANVRPQSAAPTRPPSGSPRGRLPEAAVQVINKQIESHFRKVGMAATPKTSRPQSATPYSGSRPPSTIPLLSPTDSSSKDQRPMFSTSPKHRHTRVAASTATLVTRNALNRIVAAHLSYKLPVADAAFLRANGTIQRAISEVQRITAVEGQMSRRPPSSSSKYPRPATPLDKAADEAYYSIREDTSA